LLEAAVDLLAAAGAAALDDMLLLLELLLLLEAAGLEPEELLADLLMPLCPRQAPLVVATFCVVPSLQVTEVVLPAGAADCA
jgi:hypothetical protein